MRVPLPGISAFTFLRCMACAVNCLARDVVARLNAGEDTAAARCGRCSTVGFAPPVAEGGGGAMPGLMGDDALIW
jgi:hypothetical protein